MNGDSGDGNCLSSFRQKLQDIEEDIDKKDYNQLKRKVKETLEIATLVEQNVILLKQVLRSVQDNRDDFKRAKDTIQRLEKEKEMAKVALQESDFQSKINELEQERDEYVRRSEDLGGKLDNLEVQLQGKNALIDQLKAQADKGQSDRENYEQLESHLKSREKEISRLSGKLRQEQSQRRKLTEELEAFKQATSRLHQLQTSVANKSDANECNQTDNDGAGDQDLFSPPVSPPHSESSLLSTPARPPAPPSVAPPAATAAPSRLRVVTTPAAASSGVTLVPFSPALAPTAVLKQVPTKPPKTKEKTPRVKMVGPTTDKRPVVPAALSSAEVTPQNASTSEQAVSRAQAPATPVSIKSSSISVSSAEPSPGTAQSSRVRPAPPASTPEQEHLRRRADEIFQSLASWNLLDLPARLPQLPAQPANATCGTPTQPKPHLFQRILVQERGRQASQQVPQKPAVEPSGSSVQQTPPPSTPSAHTLKPPPPVTFQIPLARPAALSTSKPVVTESRPPPTHQQVTPVSSVLTRQSPAPLSRPAAQATPSLAQPTPSPPALSPNLSTAASPDPLDDGFAADPACSLNFDRSLPPAASQAMDLDDLALEANEATPSAVTAPAAPSPSPPLSPAVKRALDSTSENAAKRQRAGPLLTREPSEGQLSFLTRWLDLLATDSNRSVEFLDETARVLLANTTVPELSSSFVELLSGSSPAYGPAGLLGPIRSLHKLSGRTFVRAFLADVQKALSQTSSLPEPLLELFVLLARQFGNVTQLRLAVFDCVFAHGFVPVRLLLSTGQHWPGGLNEGTEESSLLRTLQWLTAYDFEQFRLGKLPPDAQIEFLASEARLPRLWETLGWPATAEPLPSLVSDLLVAAEAEPYAAAQRQLREFTPPFFETVRSLELLARCFGWAWTWNELLLGHVWPLLHREARQGQSGALLLLGYLGRLAPAGAAAEQTELMRALLRPVLAERLLSVFSLSSQASAALALLLLSHGAGGDRADQGLVWRWHSSLLRDEQASLPAQLKENLAGLQQLAL